MARFEALETGPNTLLIFKVICFSLVFYPLDFVKNNYIHLILNYPSPPIGGKGCFIYLCLWLIPAFSNYFLKYSVHCSENVGIRIPH